MIRLYDTRERPRERCLTQGGHCLSLRECLAILLGTGPQGKGCMGVAADCLESLGHEAGSPEEESALFTALESANLGLFENIDGLGEAGRARIVASFEIARRYLRFRDRNLRIRSKKFEQFRMKGLPERALNRVNAEFRSEIREWLGFVPLYSSGDLGALCIVERGVRTHVNTDPLELFARILVLRPAGFFLFHNHPSGDLTPSFQDMEFTRKIEKLSQSLGIRMMGHGIVTSLGERWIVC